MQIQIDGAERQGLLHLLAQRIAQQRDAAAPVVPNAYGEDAAVALFDRLQPQGEPTRADVADWVEQTSSGLQFELICQLESPDSTVILAPAVWSPTDDHVSGRANATGSPYEGEWPQRIDEVRLPVAISVEHGLRPVPWHLNPATQFFAQAG